MSRLIRTTDMYMVDTEEEAATLIEEFKEKSSVEGYDITKYESKYKSRKKQGEKVDEWYIVTIQKDFGMERE